MADKRITLQCGDYKLQLLRATEVKDKEEIDSDVKKTFDEPITTPSSDGGYTIDVSIIEARSVDDFIILKKILKMMKSEEGEVSLFEDVKHREGNFTDEKHFTGVKLSSNEGTMSAEDLTAREISFIAQSLMEYVNGVEI